MFLPQELIRKKRDGEPLTPAAIQFLVDGMTNGRLVDSQVAALAMAIYFRDMNIEESTALTCAMRDSGSVLNWQSLALDGPVLDKHSTGGLGDVVSLILGPIIAACGGYVPMISGRGLGHTGGTLDKLESIAGYTVDPSSQVFERTVREAGVAIIGASRELAPADKRLYSIRDVTATVDSLPLICASILSKKLAEGLDSLVIDIKVGSGSLMANLDQSRDLAHRMVAVARQAGCKTSALLTDMNQPLASSCGNALEVMEVMDYLTGECRNSRLHEVTTTLAQMMLIDSGIAEHAEQAQLKIAKALSSGEAAERFNKMVRMLGGPQDLLAQGKSHFNQAPVIAPLLAPQDGYLSQMDCREIGLSVVALGGGRSRPSQNIDYRVGLNRWWPLGEKICKGDPLVMIHAADQTSWQKAAQRLREAILITDEKSSVPDVIYQQINE
ncbi:thymidine phosphorylase [Celerinatantimonas sp. YJH-8]|uniref:thymidine phosphorylase n=1 Tax=Celerinatantimonas sp. YJH-8 TaxID=3228714 RepID=UPI0038C7107A